MNPGLVVKLRPAGPWRIGPDSGARNRVDYIYHSDSLYSAITAAMARLGSLDEWLDATARRSQGAPPPSVCFSSCFPFLDEIGFVVPPRTIWPPTSRALISARVRWKSARFVPLGIVQAILAGQRLDENHWSVDGASECLVPAGRPGPFRTGVRWSAAVDRLTGSTERHSTACLEFRPGAGLWTVVSFVDDAAHGRWLEPVKAAFRLLADTGFGGERSRGWGRSDTPEFIDGALPDLILPPPPVVHVQAEAPVEEPEPLTPPSPPEPPSEDLPPIEDPLPGPPVTEPPSAPPPIEDPPVDPIEITEASAAISAPEELSALTSAEITETVPPIVETISTPAPSPQPLTPDLPSSASAHWLLSLFTPAPEDAVDWRRGNYTVLARGGRVDSPAGSGELKKQIQMVAEGSVVYAPAGPCGSAADVAPEGFAHPVFRAGFAVSIPLPEVS
jgi:CRISPR type III-A-associated RAMP protein Csm4